MKPEYNFFNDRRKLLRRSCKIKVFVQVNDTVKGYGHIKDISIHGVCIRTKELFAFLKPEQAAQLLNKPLDVSLVSEPLTLTGTVIRVSALENELAVALSLTSNPKRWMWLCR